MSLHKEDEMKRIPDWAYILVGGIILGFLLMFATVSVRAGDESDIARVWPVSVPMPDGMKFYNKSRYAQGVIILNGFDRHEWISSLKPRPLIDYFPWTTSGGLDVARPGWTSKAAIAIPKGEEIVVWTEY